MALYTLEDAIADIQTGLARTLGGICNQLIDRGVMNRELLLADLAQVQKVLGESGVGELGVAVPATLVIALQQGSEKQP